MPVEPLYEWYEIAYTGTWSEALSFIGDGIGLFTGSLSALLSFPLSRYFLAVMGAGVAVWLFMSVSKTVRRL